MHKKFLFKVHLILGLTAGFVLMIIGLTGSILSFEKEIIQFINKDTYFVKNVNISKPTGYIEFRIRHVFILHLQVICICFL